MLQASVSVEIGKREKGKGERGKARTYTATPAITIMYLITPNISLIPNP
jgi:hypothetical protein